MRLPLWLGTVEITARETVTGVVTAAETPFSVYFTVTLWLPREVKVEGLVV